MNILEFGCFFEGFLLPKSGLERDPVFSTAHWRGAFGDANLDSEKGLEDVFRACLCAKWSVSNDSMSESELFRRVEPGNCSWKEKDLRIVEEGTTWVTNYSLGDRAWPIPGNNQGIFFFFPFSFISWRLITL